jgi:predicted porin
MIRKPLAAAALAAMATTPAFAQSSVAITGVLDMFAGTRQLASPKSAPTPHQAKVDSGGLTTSRWGFEGNEELGGGLKAQFALSGFLRADTGETGRNATDAFWQRYAYVGLQGNFGTTRLGRQTTPTFQSSIRFNPFGESIAFSPYMLHMNGAAQPLYAPINGLDSAASNSIAYTSPTHAGFSASVLYAFGEDARSTGYNRSSFGANYGAGPFAISLTTERSKITTPGQFGTAVPATGATAATSPNTGYNGVADREVNVQGGTSYDFGVAKVYGQASRTSFNLLAGGSAVFKTFQLGTSVPIGAGTFMLSFAQTTRDQPGLADARRRTGAIGYDYFLSKRTDIYAVALNDRVKYAPTPYYRGNTVVAGIRHRF